MARFHLDRELLRDDRLNHLPDVVSNNLLPLGGGVDSICLVEFFIASYSFDEERDES